MRCLRPLGNLLPLAAHDASRSAAAPKRMHQRTGLQLGAAGAVIVLLLAFGNRIGGSDTLPDFDDYDDVAEKKAAFFDYLAPHIDAVNARILDHRRHLQAIRSEIGAGGGAGWLDRRWLARIAADYDLERPEIFDAVFVDRLLRRVDVIPPSLVLAQAANESAWGTSRFAQLGNNLFGMRSYEPGTGIVPKKRPRGETWEVAAYDSVRDSIDAYVHTLNTHSSYRHLRSIRHDLRRQNRPVTGGALAGGLTRYSEKGYEYVAIIRAMIRSNNLTRYDAALHAGN